MVVKYPDKTRSPSTLPSRRSRFFAGYFWLVLKNVIGWLLIIAAFIAVPVVPGPAGIPLFLIGFALISLPGKRRMTARVLRGRPFRFHKGWFLMICTGAAVILPAIVLLVARHRSGWLWGLRSGAIARGPFVIFALYLLIALLGWVMIRLTPHVLNLSLRIISKARRKFRPWLRRHRISLLPPRRRLRRSSEPGRGPLRLKDEILKFCKKRPQHN